MRLNTDHTWESHSCTQHREHNIAVGERHSRSQQSQSHAGRDVYVPPAPAIHQRASKPVAQHTTQVQ